MFICTCKPKIHPSVYLFIITVCMFVLEGNTDTTEDWIWNPSFEIVDDSGLPVDWHFNKMEETNFEAEADKFNKKDGAQSLKFWPKHGGLQKDLHITQDFEISPAFVFTTEKKLYYRAWVKYVGVNAISGFQLVLDQAYAPGADPWWIPIEWSNWWQGTGESEWKMVEGTVEYAENNPKGEPNAFVNRIYLSHNVAPGCTVWVDGIEVSLKPYETISIQNTIQKNDRSITFRGNQVTFTHPTNYHIQIFSANGKRYINHYGYGKTFNLMEQRLPSGYYLVKLHSGEGNLHTPFIVNGP